MNAPLADHPTPSQEQAWQLSDATKNTLEAGAGGIAYASVAGGLLVAEGYAVYALNIPPATLAGHVVKTLTFMPIMNGINHYNPLDWSPAFKVGAMAVMAGGLVIKGASLVSHWGINDWAEAGLRGAYFMGGVATKVAAIPFIVPHLAGVAALNMAQYGTSKAIESLEFSQSSNPYTIKDVAQAVGAIAAIAGAVYGGMNGGLAGVAHGVAAGGIAGFYGVRELSVIGDNDPTALIPPALAACSVFTNNMPKMKKMQYMAATGAVVYAGTWAVQQLMGLLWSDQGEPASLQDVPSDYPVISAENDIAGAAYEAL